MGKRLQGKIERQDAYGRNSDSTRSGRKVISTDRGRAGKKQTIQDLKYVTRSILGGWDVDDDVRRECMESARHLITSPDAEIRVQAIKLFQAADTMRLKAVEMSDKATRLDNGDPTDVVRFKPMSFGVDS